MGFSSETHIKVWDDECGSYIQVGPDADSLGLIELRAIESDGREHSRMTMVVEQAKLVADAILELTRRGIKT